MHIPFKTYLVGGAVRDQLLDRPVHERDWVVVGATPEAMLALGFQQVGNSFPVFLHPDTKEEYALARHEKKIAAGYQGFVFDTSSQITLEEDLLRRDLTINAIAQDTEGKLIDPFHGQRDLNQRVLRHVSEAFVEDPVRLLRIARFAARFGDFDVAPETQQLMQHMVNTGEIDALVSERVWKEWSRAFMEPHAELFYQVLAQCGALVKVLPELVPYFQPPYEQSPLHRLSQHLVATSEPIVRFLCLMSLLSPTALVQLNQRLTLPRDYLELSKLIQQEKTTLLQANPLSPQACLQLLERLDAFRRPERFNTLLTACQQLATFEHIPDTTIPQLNKAYENCRQVDVKQVIQPGMSGQTIKQAIADARLAMLTRLS